ncbi:MAG: hypothetical protein Kow0063_40490 [Anaerolineae bacterium]
MNGALCRFVGMKIVVWGRLADWPAGPPWGKVCPTISIYQDAGAARKGAALPTLAPARSAGVC